MYARPMITLASKRAEQSRPNMHIAQKKFRLNIHRLSMLFFFKARRMIHQLRHMTIADGMIKIHNHAFVIMGFSTGISKKTYMQ